MRKEFIESLKEEVKGIRHAPQDGDHNLLVKFFVEEEQQQFQSAAAGKPVYKDVLMIDIAAAPLMKDGYIGVATRKHKERFLPILESFIKKLSILADGTDLRYLPGVRRSEIQACHSAAIFTIEALAELPHAAALSSIEYPELLLQSAKRYINGMDTIKVLEVEKALLESQVLTLKRENQALRMNLKSSKKGGVTNEPVNNDSEHSG